MRASRAEESVDVRALADEDLVPLMARGDARAFEAIYERHSGAAYSLAYRMVGARASAEDVTQEAFMNLWRSGAHYDRRRGSVRTWVLGIVHHRAIDALRRASVHSRRRSDDETAAERLEAPERVDEDVARRDEAATVRAAIDHLPADQVKVIELAYFGGFTHVEIADMLDTPVGTVKGRMRLGLKKLHEALAHGAVASEAVTRRPKGASPRGEAE
jgi:RNA polymerase sigma-70 factor, ECF subfamily